MALTPNHYGQTANLEAAFNELLRASKKLCMQALAWKLLGQLEARKVGTAEVEADSLRRSWQREVKKGYQKGMKEFKNSDSYRRDKEYVKGLMSLRTNQAKSDWMEARTQYRKLKDAVKNKFEAAGQAGKTKSKMKAMVRKYNEMYKEGRDKHTRKVDFLESKHCKDCLKKSKETLEKKEKPGTKGLLLEQDAPQHAQPVSPSMGESMWMKMRCPSCASLPSIVCI